MSTDVVVVGGGPVGMMLAAELRLGGARVVLLEQLDEPSGHSRAFRMQARMLDVLDQRGLLARFTEGNRTWDTAHFAGLRPLLDFGHLANEHPYALLIPQARTEELLEKHGVALGADVRRGHRLTGLRDGPDGMVCEVEGPDGAYQLRAAYLVGCDGGRSATRKLAGIGFSGSAPSVRALLGDVELTDPGQLPDGVPGTMRTPRGLLMAVSLQPGITRILTTEFAPPDPDSDREPVSLEELRGTVHRITGIEVGIENPRWTSRFTDTTRLADTYRQGRVFLAGDAAHVHFPIGAQGLNLGLQDAVNLGWKLAATVAGTAPEGLLDSYDEERRPVARRVLRETRVQLTLMDPDPERDPLREMFGELLALPDVNSRLAHEITGLDVGYDLPGGPDPHPLLGHPCPPLSGPARDQRNRALSAGQGVLLAPADAASAAVVGHGWGRRVAVVPTAGPELLLRPDGHVAWAPPRARSASPTPEVGPATEPGEAVGTDELTAALHRWFGAAGPADPSSVHDTAGE